MESKKKLEDKDFFLTGFTKKLCDLLQQYNAKQTEALKFEIRSLIESYFLVGVELPIPYPKFYGNLHRILTRLFGDDWIKTLPLDEDKEE